MNNEPTPAKIGYARVSTDDQDVALQVEALQREGCLKVFSEYASGGRWDRPQLHAMLDFLRPGDTVVVHRLDRLSRTLADLIIILDRIKNKGAKFKSLTEAIDTTTPAGMAMLHIAGVFAEFERSVIRERTTAGLARARAQGRHPGRPSKIKPHQAAEILRAHGAGEKSQAELARLFNLHPSAVCRLIASNRK